jgi:hypothetical protein
MPGLLSAAAAVPLWLASWSEAAPYDVPPPGPFESGGADWILPAVSSLVIVVAVVVAVAVVVIRRRRH